MRFESPMTPDVDRTRIVRLADAAEAFAKTYAPPHHLYKALDQEGVTDPESRAELIGKIKAELHRRKPVPLAKRADLIEDARIQELRHPKDDEDEA